MILNKLLSIAPPIHTETFANGLTLLIEPMPWLRTAACSLSIHAGINAESLEQGGLASMVCEMVQRGAGRHNSRELVAIQDNLGIDRSASVSSALASFSAAMPAESLAAAIALYADIVRRPHLPGDQLDDARLMAIQELRAIEDEPTQRLMRRLRKLQYGESLGRDGQGTEASLQAISQDDVREFFTQHYHAGSAILAIAGNVDLDAVVGQVRDIFADWKSATPIPLSDPVGQPGYEHEQAALSQTHIGFSFDSIPYGHPDYFRMRAGIGILSDGMSSRLFDRVREQRGLCYTVAANCHSLLNAAAVFGYAGTTAERAQETLDVTLGEIEHLIDDLQPSELERWKVRIQSSLIMEQESSASRASSLAADFYQLGRVMTTAELEAVIEAITLDDIRQYWSTHPPCDYRLFSLGSERLQAPQSNSVVR